MSYLVEILMTLAIAGLTAHAAITHGRLSLLEKRLDRRESSQG